VKVEQHFRSIQGTTAASRLTIWSMARNAIRDARQSERLT